MRYGKGPSEPSAAAVGIRRGTSSVGAGSGATRAHHLQPKGELLIPQSNGDQKGKGGTAGVNYQDELCPVAAAQKWMGAASIEARPIFQAVLNTAMIVPDDRDTPLSGQTVRNAVRSDGDTAGLNGEKHEPGLRL